jgi:hypothetical protein
MPDASPEVSFALANVADNMAGGPAQEATRPGRVGLLQAIEHWDRRLWRRLDDIVTPPGTRGKPRMPLRPSAGVPVPNEDRPEWLDAVSLLKQKTTSSGRYSLEVLDIGEPSVEPQIATDGWIETIRSSEVGFANSQILRKKRVFAAWVSSRNSKPAAIPERSKRGIRGGRPPKYDWDGFYIEILRKVIIDYGTELPDRTVLHRQLVQWCSEWPEQPEESEIRKRLARIYDTPGILP